MEENNIEKDFVCNCGKHFKTMRSLKSHARFCKLYIKKPKKVSKYKMLDGTFQCECGKIWENFQSFNAHLSHCDIHHNSIGSNRKLRPGEINGEMQGWNKFSKEEKQEFYNKSGKTKSENIKLGITKPSYLGRTTPPEIRNKIRAGTIKYLESVVGTLSVRYNKNACKFIDNLNKENNWNLQHAENGGEIRINNYWLDGYDKDLNIAFEYDEPNHYIDWKNNILQERDIFRQNQIIEELGCEFYRYNEKLNLLYKVN